MSHFWDERHHYAPREGHRPRSAVGQTQANGMRANQFVGPCRTASDLQAHPRRRPAEAGPQLEEIP